MDEKTQPDPSEINEPQEVSEETIVNHLEELKARFTKPDEAQAET